MDGNIFTLRQSSIGKICVLDTKKEEKCGSEVTGSHRKVGIIFKTILDVAKFQYRVFSSHKNLFIL